MERNATGFIRNSFSRTSTGEGTATSSCKRWRHRFLRRRSRLLLPVECRHKKLQKRFVRERVLTRDQLAILKGVALPWGEHTYVTARSTQGEVRVEENFATNLKRLPLLLFRCRKDSHLISSVDPALSLCVCSSGIARRQRGDHRRRIRKRREK